MSKSTDWRFPKGDVARTLRKILYPGLSDHEVEAIIVCLMAHLLIENRLSSLLYRWLRQDAPGWNGDEDVSKAEDDLLKSVRRLGFFKKYSLVKPFFAMHFPKESSNLSKINQLRNDIAHGRKFDNLAFEGQPISEEATVERVFLAAQEVSMQLDVFEEMIDVPHANAERLSRRLSELES